MKNIHIYDFSMDDNNNRQNIPDTLPESELFVICNPEDIRELCKRFGWVTAISAGHGNLDDTVRYAGYDNYDFIGLIHMEIAGSNVIRHEISMFFNNEYFVLVLPEHVKCLDRLKNELCRAAENTAGKPGMTARLCFLVFNMLAADFSHMLETLEGDFEVLSETIMQDTRPEQIDTIRQLRKSAYTAKKILRAFTYVSGEILMNENGLLHTHQNRYFRSIEARYKKLYDFASGIYDLSSEILNMYDSNLSIKMNETVNKLTVITLFFGPLTLITGIYGMNFDTMPELHWKFGYPIALAAMLLVSLVIYIVLKKKKWL